MRASRWLGLLTVIVLSLALTLAGQTEASAAAAVSGTAAASGTAPVIVTGAAPDAVTAAVQAAAADPDVNTAVAVLDTQTGALYEAGAAQTEFPTESVVKVLIAANLLATGQMTGSTELDAFDMITQSDDGDADSLWGLVGGGDVVSWAEARYGIADLGSAPIEPGWWGNTKFTADGLVRLYAAVKADPVVGPWLVDAMSQMTPTAADGTDQDFGLAAQTATGAFKQGWGGDDDAFNSEQLNSTGLLGDGRYAVAIFVQHVPYEPMDALLPVIDNVAAAVARGGSVVVPASDAVPAAPTPSSAAPSNTAQSNTAQSNAAPASVGPAAVAAAAADPGQPDVATSTPARSWGVSRITAAAQRLPAPVQFTLLGAVSVVVLGSASVLMARRRRPR